MKTHLVLVIFTLGLVACDSTYYSNPQTQTKFYTGSVGGKKKVASVTLPDGFAMTGYAADMEKSLDDTTKAVNKGLVSWASFKSLSRYFDSEDSKTAANAATEKAQLSATTEQARIAADKDVAIEAMKLEAP